MAGSEPDKVEVPEHPDDVLEAAPRAGLLRFARMAGSSITGRDAAFWVTDFLNAACYRRPVGEREVDDLPVPELSPYRTAVDGLYLGSAAAFPGGAVLGVPGDAAARAAVRELGR